MPGITDQGLSQYLDMIANMYGSGRTQMPMGQSFNGPGEPDSLGSPHTAYYDSPPPSSIYGDEMYGSQNPALANYTDPFPSATHPPPLPSPYTERPGYMPTGMGGIGNQQIPLMSPEMQAQMAEDEKFYATHYYDQLTGQWLPIPAGLSEQQAVDHQNNGGAPVAGPGLSNMPNLGGLVDPVGHDYILKYLTELGIGGNLSPTTGADTIGNIVDQAGSGYGSIKGFDPGNPHADFLTSSGLAVNEQQVSENIWSNPQMAISMGGVAEMGTPGYNNLAQMGFDPYMVYLAQGGDLTGTTGVQYLDWLSDLYKTMGTRADQGGGSIAAGPLLANLVSMPPDSDLGEQMSESPQIFYDMANGIIQAGGVSPMAETAFKSQMANLYMEYLTYMSTGNANEILPINQWIAKQHPEVVDSWAGK